jgi:hypothetical protein
MLRLATGPFSSVIEKPISWIPAHLLQTTAMLY